MSKLSAVCNSRTISHVLAAAACLTVCFVCGCRRAETPADKKTSPEAVVTGEKVAEKPKEPTGREVLERMVAAYQKAKTYSDAGTVSLTAEDGKKKIIDEKANFALTLERPNKIRMQAYGAMLVCNGKETFASIEDQPGVVVLKSAPKKITLKSIFADRMLAMAMTQNFGGGMPQVMLLLGDDPLDALLRDCDEPKLIEPGEIDGRACYRVKYRRPDGPVVCWIDQETLVLRRMSLPTEEIRRAIGLSAPIDRMSLEAEFTGAQFDAEIDPNAFAFEVPKEAEVVKFFIPPHTAQLLNKPVPKFTFENLDNESFSPENLAGKVVLLDFWATWCGPCRQSLPELQKVYEKFKDNPKVAFYAVSVDQPQVKNSALAEMFENLKVSIPLLRDVNQSATAFKFEGIPSSFLIDANGIVQSYETGMNPKLVEELPEKIEKLLAGENIYQTQLEEYEKQLKQYARIIELSEEGEAVAPETTIEERKLPEVEIAEPSEPTTMKLAPLWKCSEVQSPGNIVVLGGQDVPARIFVVDNWRSVAEIGPDGKRIALHEFDLAENEVVGSLRTATDREGKRYWAAFLATQQRCHVFDEQWKPIVHYPQDALDKPHSGIADVELGVLAGDGPPQIFLSYWGVVGVQGASLEGKRLWSNRSISNALGLAIGPADEAGNRFLLCTNNTDTLTMLDAKGKTQGEIRIADRIIHWIVGANLTGDGQLSWCAMSAPKLGENLALGLNLEGQELWNYELPAGVQPQPIELIIPGKVTREGPGQWLLPGPDGSIHIVSVDGKPIDKFNYGAALQGLATVELDGQPVLLVASAKGLEALKVEEKTP